MSSKLRPPVFMFLLMLSAWSMGYAQQNGVGSLIPFSSLGAPTAIPKPALTPLGGTLILSDAPEKLTASSALPGALYRGQVEGEFRVFYHHQNVSLPSVMVGVAITNTSSQVEILLARGRGEGLSIYPDLAGQTALAGFLSSRRTIGFLKVLLPGESYFDVQTSPEGDTASAIRQYLAIALPGAESPAAMPMELFENLAAPASSQAGELPALPGGLSWGKATVTTLAYTGDQPSNPTAISVLPPDTHIRGTFPHFDRSGAFPVATSGGLQYLSIETASPGKPYANDLPGEYELGVDEVDGGTQVYNDGNYGVLYRLRIAIDNSAAPTATPFALLMQPSGGSGRYVMLVSGHLDLSPSVSYTSAWWFDELTLHGASRVIDLETSLPGGASGPQKLLFDPGFDGQ